MVAFATAVVLQLFAEVNGLLPREVGGAGHAGNTVRSMTQGAGSIGFGAAKLLKAQSVNTNTNFFIFLL